MQIPSVPPILIQALAQAAAEARLALVGGAVRDLLLHRVHQDPWRGLVDLDLVFEGRAIDLISRLKAVLPDGSGCTWREHGRFGTVEAEVVLPGGARWLLDIASARCETYPIAAGNPQVSVGSLEADLSRRDFTVNAMALLLAPPDPEVPLLDPFRGQDDLSARCLRLLHPASLTDDPTRLIRAARYSARLGFDLADASRRQSLAVMADWPWPWQASDAPQLAPPALGTRLRMELELLFAREPWPQALQKLQSWGGLALLGDGIQDSRRWVWALPRAGRLGLPLLPVLLACGKDPVAVAARLQLPHSQQRSLRNLVIFRHALRTLDARLTCSWSAAHWTEWLEQQQQPDKTIPMALACGDQPRHPLLQWWLRWRHVRPEQSARDLVASGMAPGPQIGARLRELRAQRLLELEASR
ncbi:MAG: CCA tRNA nucleotidyltransferase [Vulcanococcus sp.]|nr:CCA tRNA nucleotidyltransferase [Vulcanococcus sp.]MBW0166549.1 CCA tRNA nucleotidyltransferase [Vulcanococcus sp.]